MTHTAAIKSIIKSFSGQQRTISVPVIYVKMLGAYDIAAALSQMIYWSDRTNNEDGWFYKDYSEWDEELCIPESTMRRIIRSLEKRKLIKTKRKKVGPTPKLHFQVNMDNVTLQLLEAIEGKVTKVRRTEPKSGSGQFGRFQGNGQSGRLEAVNLEGSKETVRSTGTGKRSDRPEHLYTDQTALDDHYISIQAVPPEEKTGIEQSEQANLNIPVEQQPESLTSRFTPINSGEDQNIPPVAPQVENGMSTDKPRSQYAHPAQRMNEMFAAATASKPWDLPGRNNYDAGFVGHLRKYLKKFDVYKDGCTVYDAKRWVTKRNYTEQGIDEISLAWDEYQDSLKRKPASDQIVATSPHVEPHEKPSPEAIAEFRRKREEAAREMQRRRMGA